MHADTPTLHLPTPRGRPSPGRARHLADPQPGAPVGDGIFLPVNSMVILGEEPIVVDTGAPIHTDSWFRQVFSLVDPEDIRWIYLSHDDGDHMGSLHRLLELAPNATLVVNFFITERLALEQALPLDRMIWLGPGDHLDAGDRRLHLIVPPIFDGPTTRALYDASHVGAVGRRLLRRHGARGRARHRRPAARPVRRDLRQLNSLVSPWHQWLDPARYARHVATVEGLQPTAVASAHGPVLRGAPSPTPSRGSGPWPASRSSSHRGRRCSTSWSRPRAAG
jgi:hypothetical protein